jgi:hypothetical protein
LRVELADGDGFDPGYNSGNNRVIFKIQTCQDIFDELFVFKFSPCYIHLILVKYSAVDVLSFFVLANAMRVFTTRALIDENMPSIFFHASAAVDFEVALERISFDNEERRKLRTC